MADSSFEPKDSIGHRSEQTAGLTGELRIVKWLVGLNCVVVLTMAARLFNIV